ncbi:type II toxin-antitoxin system RelE/ParE family toxin [Calditrichota bacterium]
MIIQPSAKKDMRQLPDNALKRVVFKILALEDNPFPHDHIKLKGQPGYRLRVGDWRILYEVVKQQREVTIFAVRHRSKAYK